MRVALLAYHYIQALHLFGIQEYFIKKGHKADLFYKEGMIERPNTYWLNWEDSDLEKLKDYDRLYVFNGYASETFLQTAHLKATMKNKMFFVEKAWLPQKNQIYVDEDGLGGRSLLSKIDLSKRICTVREWSYLCGLYNANPHNRLNKGGNFILIPLQLDHDTSITLDSHMCKNMRSLVTFVAKQFPDTQIVVRPHPLMPDYLLPQLSNVMVVNDVPTLALAKDARAIIGVNSTVMIESLMHMKPVMFMGDGVLDSTSGVCLKFDGKNLHDIMSFVPMVSKVKNTLCHLKSVQFDMCNPSEMNLV